MSMLVLGAVLAGGRSSRFGSDKALASIGDRTMIDRVLAQLHPQVQRVVVCGRDYPPHPSVPDRPRAHEGPLGGLNAALHLACEHGYDAVVSVGCDMPLLPDDLVDRLAGDGASAMRRAPVVGFWPAVLAPALDRHLAHQPDRSMMRWINAVKARIVDFGDELPNINTRGDLAAFAER